MLKKIPIPLTGVMLAMATLGNLLAFYGPLYKIICGILALPLGMLLVAKVIFYPRVVKQELENPILLSVAGTFSMGLMVLSTYRVFFGAIAYSVWLIGFVLHLSLIVYFTIKFMLPPDWNKVFASYYIVYVGIGVAGVTAGVHNNLFLGKISFWFGFISLLFLFPFISYRYYKFPEVPEPARALICIYAAPVSLCLAAYVQATPAPALLFLQLMLLWSTLVYVFVLRHIILNLIRSFYPSWAAFTFPLVICALSTKLTLLAVAKMGFTWSYLERFILWPEIIIATLIVIYVYARFALQLGRKK